ncbi:transporter substrate-binding domain-containing protein [Citrobacter sp. Res13-Sevr-PEB04-36]|uniref:transporter substrate-binding domain-containing protein n=1 Tax=Citrobacter sp. Res13-Sevr-PEB04-36 TaxID=2777960 RepID=UPI0018AD0A4E|nr:transporter substrate-binding domain-containing protein [Citrobacter sp. Res13-Sevr-PEB04-36]
MNNIIKHEIARVKRVAQWLILLSGLTVSPLLMAQQNAATLDHIQNSSVLNVGYRQLPPFSFTDHNGKVTGYTIAVCNLIADKLRQYLNLNSLTIHYIPVNFAERFSALKTRKIDMDCSVNANAPERTSRVSFSVDYYIAKMRIISLRKNNIHSLADLKGRTVSLPGSSKDLLEFNKANREQHLNISTITTTTINGAFNKMAQNESAALFIDDILAWPLINHSEQPDTFSMSAETIGSDMHYAIMMRKNDPQFVTFVDSSLKTIFASPINTQLRKKWLAPYSCKKMGNQPPTQCQHHH